MKRRCAQCPAYFEPRTGHQRFCSEPCRLKATAEVKWANLQRSMGDHQAIKAGKKQAPPPSFDGLPCLSCARAVPCTGSFSGVQCAEGLFAAGRALSGTCAYWKAPEEAPPPPPAPPPPAPPERLCEQCATPAENRRFCSKPCRSAAAHGRRVGRRAEMLRILASEAAANG